MTQYPEVLTLRLTTADRATLGRLASDQERRPGEVARRLLQQALRDIEKQKGKRQ